ncbi:MAG: Uma2 family endonuclease [Janthinobacterium lividum]
MTIMQERPAAVLEPVFEKIEEVDTPQEEFLRPRRLTTAEYYHLSELGFFEDERVELLDGEIWTLPPQKTPHYAAIRRTVDALENAFGEECDYRQQAPMTLEDGTEPEPDVLVVPGKWEDYEGHYPKPPQVLLLVEVSDTTLRKDRTKKVTDYARAGIADYWIVNLVNRQLEVYRDPAPMPNGYGYKTALILFEGDTIAPLSAPSAIVAVADLFPPPTTTS